MAIIFFALFFAGGDGMVLLGFGLFTVGLEEAVCVGSFARMNHIEIWKVTYVNNTMRNDS